ncbi:unnamed protein product [Paramecium sonneborni]|uniref:MORN repeat protein n=1 Tax=Paramecium sonneborni TaxID=65129 RepID=A0A8S1L1N1_9CILI|nr:unnamed protein product [Paramecium sonneborni]
MKLNEIPKQENQIAESIRQQLGHIKLNYDSQYQIYQPVQIINYKPNGDIHSIIFYEGQRQKQKRNGAGVQYYPDGSIYEGHWSQNKLAGFGRIIYADGEYYIGLWRQGQTHGEGTLVNKELTYKGTWEDGNGQGYLQKSNGTSYEGLFKKGRKHGSGLVKYSDNSQYKGNFIQDPYEGIGEYRWRDGKTYGGEWKNNLMNGKGELRYPNGDEYIEILRMTKIMDQENSYNLMVDLLKDNGSLVYQLEKQKQQNLMENHHRLILTIKLFDIFNIEYFLLIYQLKNNFYEFLYNSIYNYHLFLLQFLITIYNFHLFSFITLMKLALLINYIILFIQRFSNLTQISQFQKNH